MEKHIKFGNVIFDLSATKSASLTDIKLKKIYNGLLSTFNGNMLLYKEKLEVGVYLTSWAGYVSNQSLIMLNDETYRFVNTYRTNSYYTKEIRKKLKNAGVPFIEYHSVIQEEVGYTDRKINVNCVTFYVNERALKYYIHHKSHRRGMDTGKGVPYIIHQLLNESGYRNEMHIEKGIMRCEY